MRFEPTQTHCKNTVPSPHEARYCSGRPAPTLTIALARIISIPVRPRSTRIRLYPFSPDFFFSVIRHPVLRHLVLPLLPQPHPPCVPPLPSSSLPSLPHPLTRRAAPNLTQYDNSILVPTPSSLCYNITNSTNPSNEYNNRTLAMYLAN
jgi:hypothetical protein